MASRARDSHRIVSATCFGFFRGTSGELDAGRTLAHRPRQLPHRHWVVQLQTETVGSPLRQNSGLLVSAARGDLGDSNTSADGSWCLLSWRSVCSHVLGPWPFHLVPQCHESCSEKEDEQLRRCSRCATSIVVDSVVHSHANGTFFLGRRTVKTWARKRTRVVAHGPEARNCFPWHLMRAVCPQAVDSWAPGSVGRWCANGKIAGHGGQMRSHPSWKLGSTEEQRPALKAPPRVDARIRQPGVGWGALSTGRAFCQEWWTWYLSGARGAAPVT